MKTTIKVFAIIGIVIGSCAILSCLDTPDDYAFFGGCFFLAWGIIDLEYLRITKTTKRK